MRVKSDHCCRKLVFALCPAADSIGSVLASIVPNNLFALMTQGSQCAAHDFQLVQGVVQRFHYARVKRHPTLACVAKVCGEAHRSAECGVHLSAAVLFVALSRYISNILYGWSVSRARVMSAARLAMRYAQPSDSCRAATAPRRVRKLSCTSYHARDLPR